MNGILNLKLGPKTVRCFIDSGSFKQEFNLSAYHKHSYAEIHIILEGEVVYHIEKTVLHAGMGSVIFIPAGTYHCTASSVGNVCHSAIQLDSDCKIPCHEKLSKEIVSGFFYELAESFSSGNYVKLSPYISLICSNVIKNLHEAVKESTDYAYAINEFFGRYYDRDITVSDLAHYLGLSGKQTTRLVKKHTEKTFLQNLVETRMRTADYLIRNTEMTLADISRYVGYNSYSGFFKAREKYLSEHNI